jgi:hypothetical protein
MKDASERGNFSSNKMFEILNILKFQIYIQKNKGETISDRGNNRNRDINVKI